MNSIWLLPLLLCGTLALAERRSRRILAGFGHNDGNLRRLQDDFLSLLAVCSLLFALGSTQPGHTPSHDKLSVVLAVDVSTSMAAEADGISRLDEIRGKLLDFVAKLPQADLALVPFSGEAVVQVPLTGDLDAFSYFLRHLQAGQVTAPGSAPEEAALMAQELVVGKKGEKYVILVSDGERTLLTNPPGLSSDVPVYVWPVGGEEPAPVPDRNGNPRLDENGQRLLTKPEPERLRSIAEESGGKIISSEKPGEGFWGDGAHRPRQAKDGDHRQWYLLLATVALLLRHLPRNIRPYRWLATHGILSIGLILGCQPATEDQGRHMFAAALTSNESPSVRADLFHEAASHLAPAERAVALFNAGTMELAAGNAFGAVLSFEMALLLNPEDKNSRHNLALALRQMEQQPEKSGAKGGETESHRTSDSGKLAKPTAVRLAESIAPAPFFPRGARNKPAQDTRLERDW